MGDLLASVSCPARRPRIANDQERTDVKYRKKPVEIEARQLTDGNAGEIATWVNDGGHDAVVRGGDGGGSKGGTVIIRTLEGNHLAEVGDFVICGVQGEFYPCKPDIFQATYDPVEDTVTT